MTRRLRPAPCRAFTSSRLRSRRAEHGRSRSRDSMGGMTPTSPNMRGSPQQRTDLPDISPFMSMSAAQPDGQFRTEELLADVMSRLIGNARHIAVGAQSPVPAAAALLAKRRGGGAPYVSILESRTH